MMQQMRSQMMGMDSVFGGGDPFSLLGNMSALPSMGGGSDGHFQSFQSSYSSSGDGKGGQRVVEHSKQLRRAPGQVAEMKERRSDTGAGKQMMAVQRQIGNRAVKATRASDLRSGNTHQDMALLNMSDAQSGQFEKEWQGVSRGLPESLNPPGQLPSSLMRGQGPMSAQQNQGVLRTSEPDRDFYGRRGGGRAQPTGAGNESRQRRSMPARHAPQIATPGSGTPASTARSRNGGGRLALGR